MDPWQLDSGNATIGGVLGIPITFLPLGFPWFERKIFAIEWDRIALVTEQMPKPEGLSCLIFYGMVAKNS